MSNYTFELNRKTFHILGLLAPLIYYFIPKILAVIITITLASSVLYIDLYRHTNPYIQQWVQYFLGNIMRQEELNTTKLASCSWMFIGMALSCVVLRKEVTMFAWIVLFMCDSLAAIVGSKYGRNIIVDNKTAEGSMAFFLSMIMLGMLYYLAVPGGYTFPGLVLASVATTYTELYSKKFGIDDNISIPIVAGICLSIF